jgi:hypothetical protein
MKNKIATTNPVADKEKDELEIWAGNIGMDLEEFKQKVLLQAIADADRAIEVMRASINEEEDIKPIINSEQTDLEKVIRRTSAYLNMYQKAFTSHILVNNLPNIIQTLLQDALKKDGKNKIQAIQELMKIVQYGVEPETFKQNIPVVNINQAFVNNGGNENGIARANVLETLKVKT